MKKRVKEAGQVLFVLTMVALLTYAFGSVIHDWYTPSANGDTPTQTQFTLYLGKKYSAPGVNSGYEYFYSGLGYQSQSFAIISRVDNYGYSGSGIEIRVRLGATVYLGDKTYKLINMTKNFIVLEEVINK